MHSHTSHPVRDEAIDVFAHLVEKVAHLRDRVARLRARNPAVMPMCTVTGCMSERTAYPPGFTTRANSLSAGSSSVTWVRASEHTATSNVASS